MFSLIYDNSTLCSDLCTLIYKYTIIEPVELSIKRQQYLEAEAKYKNYQITFPITYSFGDQPWREGKETIKMWRRQEKYLRQKEINIRRKAKNDFSL